MVGEIYHCKRIATPGYRKIDGRREAFYRRGCGHIGTRQQGYVCDSFQSHNQSRWSVCHASAQVQIGSKARRADGHGKQVREALVEKYRFEFDRMIWDLVDELRSIKIRHGITHELASPDTPQYNWVAERSLGLLREKTISMLQEMAVAANKAMSYAFHIVT